MATRSVEALLDDIRHLGGEQLLLVESVRALVKRTFSPLSEEVKYGGILFSSGVMFSGVFAYRKHVSVEFSHGAGIVDPHGYLEGAGKGRRHIKLIAVDDIQRKHLAEYLQLALEASKAA